MNRPDMEAIRERYERARLYYKHYGYGCQSCVEDIPDLLAHIEELAAALRDVEATAGELLAVFAWPRDSSCVHGNSGNYGPWHCDMCWYDFIDTLRRAVVLVEE